MSTDRTVRLSPRQLAIKAATREAVHAAGGQVFVAHETGRTQSRISDYCSAHTADFMPADVIAAVEALSAGAPGHPHVTRALARAQGALVLDGPLPADPATGSGASISCWLAHVAGESADVIRVLASGGVYPGAAAALADGLGAQQRAVLARELDQLIDVLAGLNAVLGRGADERSGKGPDSS